MSTDEQIRDRARLKSYIEREQLVCILNNTKWEKLFRVLEGIQGKLDFKRKDVRESEKTDQRWDGDIYHVFGLCENIEWLEIRAQISIPKGALIEPKVEDYTNELITLVKDASVPFSRTKEGIKVWGYVRPGTNPDWEK